MRHLSAKQIFLFLFVLLTMSVYAETASLNSKPEYKKNLEKLLPLAESGTKNADLFYNLGVCYYHTGHTGKAVLWFLRAQNLNSAHRQAKENLVFIEALHPRDVAAPQRPYLTQVLINFYDFFSLNRLAIIVLLLGLLAVLSLHWLLHYPQEKERGLPVLALSIVLSMLLLFGAALILKNHRYLHNSKAVVMQESASILASPGKGKALLILPEGSVVNIKLSQQEYAQVILADGFSGWIKADQLERVVPLKKAGEK